MASEPLIEGLVALELGVKVTGKDMAKWSPDRVRQFFHGLAEAIAAVNGENDPRVRLISLYPEFNPDDPPEIQELWWEGFHKLGEVAKRLSATA